MHPQHVSDEEQIRVPGIPPPALVALDAPPVHAGEVAEFFL